MGGIVGFRQAPPARLGGATKTGQGAAGVWWWVMAPVGAIRGGSARVWGCEGRSAGVLELAGSHGCTDAEKGITRYTYGPFGFLHTVTDPGGAITRFERDAMGRVRRLEDPDRGTTFISHDGFGEVVSSTDALGRVVTWECDGLGRTLSRLDQQGAESQVTTWRWDTAAFGIGKLRSLSSPDGDKTYTYTPRG
jgi:YD repeat-containing protein